MACLELNHRIGFVTSLYSVVESSFRVYVEYFNPDFYARNRLKPSKLFKHFFQEILREKHKDGSNSLEFLALVRNSIHNNGIFRPPDDRPKRMLYREIEYEFLPDQMIKFVGWALLLEIADDMRGLLVSVSRDGAISEVGEPIQDPTRPYG
jgi:hypothetical protein